MTVASFSYHPPRKKKDLRNVAALPDGADLLHLFHGFVKGAVADDLVRTDIEKYSSVEKLEPFGRTLTLTLEVGRFGEDGRVKNRHTHAVEHTYDKDRVNAVKTHGVVLVPKEGTHALFFVERAAGIGGMTRLMEQFELAFRKRYGSDKWIPKFETLIEPEQWLDHVDLTSVTAVRYDYEADFTRKGIPKVMGTLETTLNPSKGQDSLPDKLWANLRNSSVKDAALLAFEGIAEQPDELRLKVNDRTNKTKTFILGAEKQPPVQYLLTDAGQAQKNSSGVLQFCLDEADDIFPSLGVDWETTDQVGTWTSAQLNVQMAWP
ncbi:hypothetical protein [Rhodococcoides fascians]|uniref:hypothetical protein n=1 Tax=Rhodococcoides fascians TaxID=1828 RepID=UPI00050CE900|nr:hypothetical protein [Rhodococcus fascians]